MTAVGSFRSEQKKFSRVKRAYTAHEKKLKTLFSDKKIPWEGFNLILVGYKTEKKLEVFASARGSHAFSRIKTYDFCVLSGSAGPKRKEGDNQVPEGFYAIDRFNPASNFHLSVRVDYPNASDRILSDKKSPGGEIYIHGKCVSVGCIPITDACIEELYVLCVEAKNGGQARIPVYIFPFRMTKAKMKAALRQTHDNKGLEAYWKNLRTGYERWNTGKKPLKYTVDKKGKYLFQ